MDEAYCVKADIASNYYNEHRYSVQTDGGAVTVPAPTQSEIIANCQEYYAVKAEDTCASIASAYGITVSQFEAWNPAVGGKLDHPELRLGSSSDILIFSPLRRPLTQGSLLR